MSIYCIKMSDKVSDKVSDKFIIEIVTPKP